MQAGAAYGDGHAATKPCHKGYTACLKSIGGAPLPLVREGDPAKVLGELHYQMAPPFSSTASVMVSFQGASEL